jgi:hypothetical protein
LALLAIRILAKPLVHGSSISRASPQDLAPALLITNLYLCLHQPTWELFIFSV